MSFLDPTTANAGPLLSELTSQIRRCLEDYHISPEGPLVIGLSGGKDSSTLCLALSAMGLTVLPAIVDLGYRRFSPTAVAEYMRSQGLPVTIVRAHSMAEGPELPVPTRSTVRDSLRILGDPDLKTPCSACSTVKRLLLADLARRTDAHWVLLGHHREDFVATLLKDYYVDRYYQVSREYLPDVFRDFVERCPLDLSGMETMVGNRTAATMALRAPLASTVQLLRPLMYVNEDRTRSFVERMRIPIAGSGCGHDAFADPCGQAATKREIVHAHYSRLLATDPALGDRLLGLARLSLDASGRPYANPRSERSRRYPGFERDGAP